jgi:hypothetical protein
MEDELWNGLYPLIQQEHNRRPRRKRVRFNDAIILLVALWAILHDRPICWACRAQNWPAGQPPWAALPSPATMSRRLRTLSLQLLLEQIFCRLWAAGVLIELCCCRRIDSKPLAVGGFSKDRDARWGYATGGHYKGYKLFACWGNSLVMPQTLVLGPMNRSDQAGTIHLIDRLEQLHGGLGGVGGYLLADSTNDTNPAHDHAAAHGFQLLTPRKEPGTGLGHRDHSPARLRSIELLEGPHDPVTFALSRAFDLGPCLYGLRGQIERDYGQMGNFGGGLQPLPSWVRRPHRLALWVIVKLIINGMRICMNHGLRA